MAWLSQARRPGWRTQLPIDAFRVVHPVMPDLRLTVRTLIGMGKNPNCGAVIVVDHHKETGCEAEEIGC